MMNIFEHIIPLNKLIKFIKLIFEFKSKLNYENFIVSTAIILCLCP